MEVREIYRFTDRREKDSITDKQKYIHTEKEIKKRVMKKLKSNQGPNPEDKFSCLPDKALICIFTKLANLKFLCRCSIVCKKFASIMPQIRSVSLILPSREVFSFKSTTEECGNFQRILNSENLPAFIQSGKVDQKLNFIIFLLKFKNLESIYLEFTCPKNIYNSPLLHWKAKCEHDWAKIDVLVCLVPGSIQKVTERQVSKEQENLMYPSDRKSLRDNCLGLCWSCIECLHLLCVLIKCHHSLKIVTMTNSAKQGKLVLKDEQLMSWRDSLLYGDGFDSELPLYFTDATVPVLNLPSSGYKMKKVYVMFIKFLELVGDDVDDNAEDYDGDLEIHETPDFVDEILTWDFEEEEKLLGEAVKRIIRKHGDILGATEMDFPNESE